MADDDIQSSFKDTLSGMPTRQKIMIGMLILLIIFIIWQVMDLFGGKKSVKPPVKAPAAVAAASGGASSPASSASVEQVEKTALRQTPVTTDIQFSSQQKVTEQQYVSKLNELQMLQIQRQIAEANQAISASKLATVTAEKNISDLLTKPDVPPPSPVAYANQLVGPSAPGGAPMPLPPVASKDSTYLVISVSMQLNKWNAVLGYEGKLYNVAVGDILPIDNSKVVKIDREGVTLRKNGATRRITLVSSI